jgi:hypothetical protein
MTGITCIGVSPPGPSRDGLNLEDHVEVERANYDNGLLRIDLVRKIPEAMKPRKIEIGSDNPPSKPKSLSAA